MNDLSGRDFFESVYNDEMAIPEGHDYGAAQELNFEDASVREAAYAGWMLAMNCTHEHLSNARLAIERLRNSVIGPVNNALNVLGDEQHALSNFRYQLNKHRAARREDKLLTVESVYDHESVVEHNITSVKQIVAPHYNRSQLPKFVLEANEHFNLGIVLEFDKYYPVGYTFSKLFMANGIGPAGKDYQQNVFVVLEIRGDADLYRGEYAISLCKAYEALGQIAKRCANICPVGDIRPLGENMHGGPVKALVMPLMMYHHEFQRIQQL
jgi:hypothetical protein